MAQDQETKRNKREKRGSLFIVALLMMIILGAVTGALSLALGTGGLGFDLFKSYFADMRLLLFNIAPVVLLHLAVYMLVGRPWLAFLLSSGSVLFFSFLEHLKIVNAGDVLWFSDFISGEAFDYISDASAVKLNVLAIGCLVYLIAFTTLLLVFFLRRRSAWFAGRLILFAAIAGFSFWGFKQVTNVEKYPVEPQYDGAQELGEYARAYVSRGYIYPLMLTVGHDDAEDAPGGYDKAKAAKMLAAYEAEDIPEERAVSIVAVQLESFADLTQLDLSSLGYTADDIDIAAAYEDYSRIKAFSMCGTLVTGSFSDPQTGPERTFLTGFVHPGTIRTYANSYVQFLRDQDYETRGIVLTDGKLYNRERVCSYLGFDSFEFADAQTETDGAGGSGNTDWTLYSKVYETWKEGLSGGSSRHFVFAVSTQNAGPFDGRNALSDYLAGIRDSFFYLSNMLDRMEQDAEPVVVLIYSNHAPELDKIQDQLPRDTKYLIWANSAAKAVLGAEFSGTGRTMSTAFLMPELFRLCGLGGPSFMKASQELSADVPVMLEDGTYMISGSAELTQDLPLELQSRVYNHNYMEYCEKTNFRYQR